MRRVWFGVVLLAMTSLSGFGQKKEQDRVANAGTVMQEILNIPDDIPQSVIDKADCVVVLPSVLKFAIRNWRKLRPRCESSVRPTSKTRYFQPLQ